jgi:hypothetical protein
VEYPSQQENQKIIMEYSATPNSTSNSFGKNHWKGYIHQALESKEYQEVCSNTNHNKLERKYIKGGEKYPS